MTDPFTAAKRDLEERDRIKLLAADARAVLNKLENAFGGWEYWPREDLISELLDIMSWGDAHNALNYIEWDDNRGDEESDP